MPYFLDSNVVLGFVFRCSDRLGERACAVVGVAEGYHSGPVVRPECFGEGRRQGRADELMRGVSKEVMRDGAGNRRVGVMACRSRSDVR